MIERVPNNFHYLFLNQSNNMCKIKCTLYYIPKVNVAYAVFIHIIIPYKTKSFMHGT